MPRVKIDYIVSFSNEDPDNPASALLEQEISRRKWLGNKGESSHSVVLQLAKSTKIQSVTLGSCHSALVEVLVGRSEKPADPFKVLVLSSVFMSPSESKKDEPVSKVRTFHYEQLAADTRDQNWDRLRVVCLQPYNKHVKFGLSFIHIFEPESPTNKTVTTTECSGLITLPSSQRFQIEAESSDDESSYKPGEMFEKMKNSPQLSVDAQIRKASRPSSFLSSSNPSASISRIINKIMPNKRNSSKISEEKISRDRSNILYEDEEEPNDKIDKIIQRDREEKEIKQPDKHLEKKTKEERHHRSENGGKNKDKKSRESNKTHRDFKTNTGLESRETMPKNKDKESSSKRETERDKSLDSSKRDKDTETTSSRLKRRHSEEKISQRPSKKLKPGPRSASPHQLMSGVVFVMSGYQNPARATLRDKALAMGAQYRQDWGRGCTHLICAFSNTPKLRQVRSSDESVPIVKGEWIEDCCKERRLLPWQWYATESDYRVKKEWSEEEEPTGGLESDCDTDDEIQKAVDKQKLSQKDNTQQNSSRDSDVKFVCDERVKGNVTVSDSETDEYTDEEKTEEIDARIIETNNLPDFFEGYTFAVDNNLENYGLDLNLLKRYIIAYSGEIVEHICADSTVNYLVTADRGCRMKKEVKSAVLVRPEWIWKCHKKLKKVPSKDYTVK